MRLLTAVERFFERLFERPTARIFRARLQPVHLQRRIERTMDVERLSGAERTFVPNHFRLRLQPDDLAAFGDLADSLAGELADGALAFARAHRYTLVDRPRVDLLSDPRVLSGEIEIDAEFAGPDGARVDPLGEGRPVGTGVAAGAADDSRTRVFEVPAVEAPLAVLREIRPDGTEREIRVDGRPLTIGRAGDNAVVLRDARVSRHHGRLQARRGALVYTDLGSTNGTRVNGFPVREVVLGEGDRIELGDTVLLVETVQDD